MSDSIKGDARDLVARMLVVNVEYRIKVRLPLTLPVFTC